MEFGILFTTQRFEEFATLPDREFSDFIGRSDLQPSEERRDSDVCNGVLVAHSVTSRGRQEVLDCFSGCQEVFVSLPTSEELLEGRDEFRADDLDEESGLCTTNGVLWDKVGLWEEIRDEFDEDERLGKLHRLGRWLLRGNIRTPVRNGRYLYRVGADQKDVIRGTRALNYLACWVHLGSIPLWFVLQIDLVDFECSLGLCERNLDLSF